MKTAKVWVAPYDKWNRINERFNSVAFIFVMVTIFFHPLWLSLITGIAWGISSAIFFILLWLNERKKHRLAKVDAQKKRHISD